MIIKTDLHCHTVASTHAFSTVMEIAKAAKDAGLEAVAITDHCPNLPDAPHSWHFECLKNLPKTMSGILVLRGCEANILNSEGEIDLEERILQTLDIVVASIHKPVYENFGEPDHTKTYLNVLENKYVDILGHSGNPKCLYDIDVVLKRAKELGKFIEINNHSFRQRPANVEICRTIAERAKAIGTGIVVNSDAHFCLDVGKFDFAIKMLKEIDFPEELIMNRSVEVLQNALSKRKQII